MSVSGTLCSRSSPSRFLKNLHTDFPSGCTCLYSTRNEQGLPYPNSYHYSSLFVAIIGSGQVSSNRWADKRLPEVYSIRKNKIMLFAEKWVQIEITTLNKIARLSQINITFSLSYWSQILYTLIKSLMWHESRSGRKRGGSLHES